MRGMEETFEGTIVLEQLAEAGLFDDFFEAIDSDDVDRATSLMQEADIDASTIARVVQMMKRGDGEH
jgi:hypothetical protein